MSWHSFRPYVSAAQRRAKASKVLAKMSKKGQGASPVNLIGWAIAKTFWGKAWCDHLESYSDFQNRLPRGRTYVRNGSVVDLQITAGKVTALVSGSDMYKIKIGIKPVPNQHWNSIQANCAGKIDSLLELIQGKLSAGVMGIVTDREKGLFPKPAEIEMDCSCPDWAGMCKHIAATLYGVGARLDEKPELLFLLRDVDPAKLISKLSAAEAVRQPLADGTATLTDEELTDVFGIELAGPRMPDQATKFPEPSKPELTPVSIREPKAKPPKKRGTAGCGRLNEANNHAPSRRPEKSARPSEQESRRR